MENAIDSNKVLGAILTDLSKAFDCICHDLLLLNYMRMDYHFLL